MSTCEVPGCKFEATRKNRFCTIHFSRMKRVLRDVKVRRKIALIIMRAKRMQKRRMRFVHGRVDEIAVLF